MATQSLAQITIIIPTVARPEFVRRQFAYWGETDANVFILDGADKPIAIPSAETAQNVRYIHTGTKFNERLATASQFVKTKYAALLPDDEFYLPSGLRACMDRLDTDSSIVGCVGRSLYFFVDQGRFLVSDAYRDWKPFTDGCVDIGHRLDEDLPPNKTHKAQFGVFRSEIWNVIFERSYGRYFSCGYTYERLINLQRTVSGRTEILESVLWMRSKENPPISNESVPRVAGRDFVSWARNPEFAGEHAEYRQIARNIIESGGVGSARAAEFEERFFVGGIHRQATKEVRNSRRLKNRLGTLMLTRTPKTLRLFAKRYLPSAALGFTGWEGHDLDKMCASLTARGTQFSRAELDKVESLSLEMDMQLRGTVKKGLPNG